LAPAKYQSEAEPSEAEMKAYYDGHKTEFKNPREEELRHHRSRSAENRREHSACRHAASVRVTTNRRSEFQTPERVKARHILLKADASNDAQVKPKAEALLKQIQGRRRFRQTGQRELPGSPGSGAQGRRTARMDYQRPDGGPSFEKGDVLACGGRDQRTGEDRRTDITSSRSKRTSSRACSLSTK